MKHKLEGSLTYLWPAELVSVLLGPKCRRWTLPPLIQSEWGAAPILAHSHLPAQSANNVKKVFGETRNLEMHMYGFRQRSEH